MSGRLTRPRLTGRVPRFPLQPRFSFTQAFRGFHRPVSLRSAGTPGRDPVAFPRSAPAPAGMSPVIHARRARVTVEQDGRNT